MFKRIEEASGQLCPFDLLRLQSLYIERGPSCFGKGDLNSKQFFREPYKVLPLRRRRGDGFGSSLERTQRLYSWTTERISILNGFIPRGILIRCVLKKGNRSGMSRRLLGSLDGDFKKMGKYQGHRRQVPSLKVKTQRPKWKDKSKTLSSNET